MSAPELDQPRPATVDLGGELLLVTSVVDHEIGPAEALLPADLGRDPGLRVDALEVAVGDEATLLAIHDRLMRDMRPIEERMAARGLPPLPAGRTRSRNAFPMLGPAETERRARRALTA